MTCFISVFIDGFLLESLPSKLEAKGARKMDTGRGQGAILLQGNEGNVGIRDVMTKVIKDRAELEAMVLAELRQMPHCEDACSVTVIGLDDERVEATWDVSNFNAGESVEDSCEAALRALLPGLQRQFDLAID
jgi:hypothetical protein